MTIQFLFIVVATVLSSLAVFKSGGKSEVSWVALFLSLALLLPRLG